MFKSTKIDKVTDVGHRISRQVHRLMQCPRAVSVRLEASTAFVGSSNYHYLFIAKPHNADEQRNEKVEPSWTMKLGFWSLQAIVTDWWWWWWWCCRCRQGRGMVLLGMEDVSRTTAWLSQRITMRSRIIFMCFWFLFNYPVGYVTLTFTGTLNTNTNTNTHTHTYI